MSHPCGDYNKDTLNILESLGLEIGFKANLETCILIRNLEYQEKIMSIY